MDSKEILYALWLWCTEGMDGKKIELLLRNLQYLENIYAASEEERKKIGQLGEKVSQRLEQGKTLERWKKLEEMLQKKRISFTWKGQKDYPPKLMNLPDAPFGLFYIGRLPADDKPAVAVVGARNVTHEGKELAFRFGRELAENGVSVISGLARGVDIASHRGVLSVAGGCTYGVLGCGIDVCYPSDNRVEYMEIPENGGILSEFPPGLPPFSRNFPRRNRIISGLSDGILVVEAGQKSGSLITANIGLEQGKDLFVIPGNISHPSYKGSNKLIQTGAALVTDTSDILDALGIFLDENVSQYKKKREVLLETKEKIVYSYLSLEPIHISKIAKNSKISLQTTMEMLISLEMKKLVKDVGNHYYAIVL